MVLDLQLLGPRIFIISLAAFKWAEEPVAVAPT